MYEYERNHAQIAKDGIQESELEDKVRHVGKSILSGGRTTGFEGLTQEMRQAFREGLKTASPESQELLRQWKRKAKYRIAPGKRSRYRVSNGVITLGRNADASTVAHELFHWVDGGGHISSQLFEPLMQDYVALKMASEGSVKEYLIEHFPEMFEMRGKAIVMRPEYRGISDILNGLSGGTESYGFGHDEEYWSKPGNLEAEVWAEFGMHQYENIEIALEMFQTLFPNLYKSAIIKLKELK